MTSLPSTVFILYIPLDLIGLCSNDVTQLLEQNIDQNDKTSISSIVVAIRPQLFDKYIFSNMADRMVEELEVLLRQLFQRLPLLNFILCISSLAAADHLRTQSFANEKDPDPPLLEYSSPYDRCKRQSEGIIAELCRKRQLSSTHLRLSAIFSGDFGCIQCCALGLQARVGCYLPLAIDCNSSLSISMAIYVLLEKVRCQKQQQQQSVYYYTRPLTLTKPVPYGYYLTEYRKAYDIQQFSLWIPVWIVTSFVRLVHVFASCMRLGSRRNRKFQV